jgi:hypothetical protein
VGLAHNPPLTVLTCDADFRDAALRGGLAVLFCRHPEAFRARLTQHFDEVLALLQAGERLVSLRREDVIAGKSTRSGRARRQATS